MFVSRIRIDGSRESLKLEVCWRNLGMRGLGIEGDGNGGKGINLEMFKKENIVVYVDKLDI